MRDRSGRREATVRRAAALCTAAVVLLTALAVAGHATVAPPRGGGSLPTLRPLARDPRAATPTGLGAAPLPANWTELTNSTLTPPLREAGTMVFDPTLGAFVLFGGLGTLNQPLNDTWTFAHGNWTNLTGALPVAPAARWYASFTWDAADGYALLFGGRNGTADFNDTWSFNGTAWTDRHETTAPPPLASGLIAYDAADDYVLLSGGLATAPGHPGVRNVTWSYQGGTWTNLSANVTGSLPNSRVITNVAYDAADGYVVMFGGTGDTGALCASPGYTWSYSAGHYTNLSANLSTAPPGAFGSRMMAYDPAYSGVIVYGGLEEAPCPLSSQTWLFRGGAWYNLTTPYGPGPLWDGQMATDTTAQAVLEFSGVTGVGTSGQTWNFTPALSVTAAANTTVGVAPLSVNLTASAVGLGPLAFNWTFSDGTPPGLGPNVTHTFLASGVYHPRVNVTDALGRERAAILAVTVVDTLSVNATASPAVGDAPSNVSFSDLAVGGRAPETYNWSFGDGGTSTSANPAHTFESPGRYNWSVNTSDSLGEHVRSTGIVTVNPPLVLTGFHLSPTIGVVPFTVYANVTVANGTGPGTATWSFGDGTPSVPGGSVAHTFDLAGTFTGHVTVHDEGGGQVIETFNVTAVAPLAASVVASPVEGAAPLAVDFSAPTLGGGAPFSYQWSFGLAGATSTAAEPSFVYTVVGVFTANVSVGDAAGEFVTASTTITVGHPLVANLTQGTYAGIAPANLSLSVMTTGGLGPFSVQWSFGDGGAVLAGLNVSHFYLHPGSFSVHATVTDRAGDSYSATATAIVVAALSVTLNANASVVDVGAPFTLTALTSGGDPPLATRWDSLLPGCAAGPSDSLVLNCTPTMTGTYTATVTVMDALGESRNASTTVVVFSGGGGSTPSGSGPLGTALPYLVIGAAGVVAVLGILLVRPLPGSGPRRGAEAPDVVIEPPRGAPKRPPASPPR